MSQIEIYDIFKNSYYSGDLNYYDVDYIYKKGKYKNISGDKDDYYRKIKRLWYFGFLEKKKIKGLDKYRFKRQNSDVSFI